MVCAPIVTLSSNNQQQLSHRCKTVPLKSATVRLSITSPTPMIKIMIKMKTEEVFLQLLR